jgi:hypothetical protein
VSDPTAICPPHHWQIDSREIDRQVYDHHRCLRCGLEKNQPRQSAAALRAPSGALPRRSAMAR